MKRFIRLIALCVAAGVLLAVIALCQAKLCFNGAQSYAFFVGDTSKNCREVRCGDDARLKRLTLSAVCGECAEYTDLDIEAFLESVNGEVIFTEELSDSVNYYCKASLPYSVTLYGEKINLHICVRADGVKVASPIIFGGY